MAPSSLSRRTVIALGAAVLPTAAQTRASRTLHASLAQYAHLALPEATGVMAADGLRARFMGVSTILFEAPSGKLLVDGFFSRPGLLRSIFSRVAPDTERIDDGLARIGAEALAGIVIAHAHHDHAMDAAEVLQRTGGVLVGSHSTVNLVRARGFDGEVREALDRKMLQLGAFEVEPILTPHSHPNLFPGETSARLPRRAWFGCYKGQSELLITDCP